MRGGLCSTPENSGIQLCSFMVAVSRVAVNHDGRGGSAPDPFVWDQGSRSKQRRVDTRFHVDLASLPGPLGFLHWPWVQVHGGCAADADVICLFGVSALACGCWGNGSLWCLQPGSVDPF